MVKQNPEAVWHVVVMKVSPAQEQGQHGVADALQLDLHMLSDIHVCVYVCVWGGTHPKDTYLRMSVFWPDPSCVSSEKSCGLLKPVPLSSNARVIFYLGAFVAPLLECS